MGFSRQEFWSGLDFLLQGIFLTQGSNLHLKSAALQADSLPLSYLGSPTMEYYSAIKMNEICSNMDGPRDYHTKWSKLDRERKTEKDIDVYARAHTHTHILGWQKSSSVFLVTSYRKTQRNFLANPIDILHCAVLSHSVMSDSLQHHRL